MEKRVLHNLNETDTHSLGQKLAIALFDGAFIALYGDLGAGKTTLARSIAAGLGIDGIISPTFTIVREYTGILPLAHFDAYRLTGAQELYDIGFEDYLARGGVILMEWSENVVNALPDDRLDIRIYGNGNMLREIEITATGPRHETVLEALK